MTEPTGPQAEASADLKVEPEVIEDLAAPGEDTDGIAGGFSPSADCSVNAGRAGVCHNQD